MNLIKYIVYFFECTTKKSFQINLNFMKKLINFNFLIKIEPNLIPSFFLKIRFTKVH